MILFSETALERAIFEYAAHGHHERNHQGLGNRLIETPSGLAAPGSDVVCRGRLGGLLKFYGRRAA